VWTCGRAECARKNRGGKEETRNMGRQNTSFVTGEGSEVGSLRTQGRSAKPGQKKGGVVSEGASEPSPNRLQKLASLSQRGGRKVA